MSGGALDYICFRMSDSLEGKMQDSTLNALIIDLIEVIHDLEWWQSGDISEEDYREVAESFKEKWLK